MTNTIPSEEIEQINFVQYLELKGIDYWHTPNSTFSKHWSVKTRNKRLGVQPGIPDLFLIINGKLHGCEMKRVKGGVLSVYQRTWIEKLENAGIPTVVAKGCDEAIAYVEQVLKTDKLVMKGHSNE